VGMLFVMPLISLDQRSGRDLVIAEGLGMIPVHCCSIFGFSIPVDLNPAVSCQDLQ